MANGYLNIHKGVNLVPAASSVNTKGDIAYNTSTDKIEVYNGAVDPLVNEAKASTLTNKTIDANSNTLSNIANAAIASGAAIAYSKLNLTGSIVNADVNASAGIVYTKLNLAGSIVNADINASAAIAYSKLSLTGGIVNADVNAAAAIAYSKLNISASIVNADVSNSAAIAYSKLNLSGSIVNADIGAGAAIAFSKLAALTSANILVGNGSNVATAVAVSGDISLTNAGVTAYSGTVPINKGGTGQITANASLNALLPSQTGANGKVLSSNGTDTSWTTPLTNPMNAIGDIIVGGSSGAATRLGIGSSSQFLKVSSGTPAWATPTPGNLTSTVQSKSTTYSVLATDDVVIMSGASWTATLPAANSVNPGKSIQFIHNDSDLSRQYTISRAGSDTINGATSTTVATQYESLILVSDGSAAWYIHTRRIPSSWVTYTPTYSAFGTVTNSSILWRRMGDSIQIQGTFTAGTTTTAEPQVTLPTGLTSDTTKIPVTRMCGIGNINAVTAWSGLPMLIKQASAFFSFGQVITGGTSLGTPGAVLTNCQSDISNGNNIQVTLEFPITGWAG